MSSTFEVALPQPCVLYVFDAYCGWCWGFARRVHELEAAYAGRVPFAVVNGGLFVGERARRIGAFAHIPDANRRITELTGAEFGAPYLELLREGNLVLDSTDAAAALAALRAQAPGRAVELAGRLQRAFYVEGQSLSEIQTAVDVARAAGLDEERVRSDLTSGLPRKMVQSDFALTRQLGVSSFPTLLAVRDGHATPLPGTGTPLAALVSAVDTWLVHDERSAAMRESQ